MALTDWRRPYAKVWWLLAVSILFATPVWAQQPGTWAPGANLGQARAAHTATLLADGKVLIAGGKDAAGQALATAELFDPATGVYSPLPAPMPAAVWGHTATLLADGRVLITGGNDTSGQPLATAHLFDPAAGAFTALSMSTPRSGHTASRLGDGRVLTAGGTDGSGALAGLDLYDPGARTFHPAGSLLGPRQRHTATVLADGRVLLAGGSDASGPLSSAELYDPQAGTVGPAGALNMARTLASAALLLDGTVLVAGGQDPQNVDLNSAEIYSPAANAFTLLSAPMGSARSGHSGVRLLHNGKVLLVGGTNAGQIVPTSEVYDPVTGTFWGVGQPGTARQLFGANLFDVPNAGRFVSSGGLDVSNYTLGSSEVFFYPTVRTDKAGYAAGDTVTLMGEGWQPNETVTIDIRDFGSNTTTTFTATADASGAFSSAAFQANSSSSTATFLATATGQTSLWTAQAAFAQAPQG